MSNWWQSREPREQVLIGIAALLTLVIIGVFGIYQPVKAANADAKLRLQNAAIDQALVRRGVQTLQGTAAIEAEPAANADTFRTLVTRSARGSGLSISRLQNSGDGGLQIVFEDVDPVRLFTWLDQMSAEPGGKVVSANISSRDAGMVLATIELQSAGT